MVSGIGVFLLLLSTTPIENLKAKCAGRDPLIEQLASLESRLARIEGREPMAANVEAFCKENSGFMGPIAADLVSE
jgi:hypothetical protein